MISMGRDDYIHIPSLHVYYVCVHMYIRVCSSAHRLLSTEDKFRLLHPLLKWSSHPCYISAMIF